MEWKLFGILTIICLLTFSIVLCGGLIGKQSLSEENNKIENVEDVKYFLQDCKKKLFLDCEELLLRRIS